MAHFCEALYEEHVTGGHPILLFRGLYEDVVSIAKHRMGWDGKYEQDSSIVLTNWPLAS
jgi:hypothetical protein